MLRERGGHGTNRNCKFYKPWLEVTNWLPTRPFRPADVLFGSQRVLILLFLISCQHLKDNIKTQGFCFCFFYFFFTTEMQITDLHSPTWQ